MSLKSRIQEDMKSAMREKNSERLQTIRLILAAIKQIEVDEHLESLDDDRVLSVLDKMMKQHRESIGHFEKASRQELVDKEVEECNVIQEYLPPALSDEEVEAIIADAISTTNAESIKDMGKVMGIIKPKLQGRADMSAVSGKIKQQLS